MTTPMLTQEELMNVATSVLEDLCFALVDEESDEDDFPVEATALVRFSGPRDGRLLIRTRGDVAGALVRDMMGEDEEVGDDDRRDGLGEIANVLCGNIVAQFGPVDSAFDLEAPRVGIGDAFPSDASPEVCATVCVDEGMIEIELSSGGAPVS